MGKILQDRMPKTNFEACGPLVPSWGMTKFAQLIGFKIGCL
jgi:hypothetical protein